MRQSSNIRLVSHRGYESLRESQFLEVLPCAACQHLRTGRQELRIIADGPDASVMALQKVGRFRSARVGLQYRALAVEVEDGLLWFWIGDHAEYERLING